LLRFLASHPGRAFTREQLLARAWDGDYVGGVRTVDVHVRRLRAKLGVEHETLIETVRRMGYRFRAEDGGSSNGDSHHEDEAEPLRKLKRG
jgi:DNA-binding response OmpR family regulator